MLVVVLNSQKNLVSVSENEESLRREEGRLRPVREILGSLFHSLFVKANGGDEEVNLS